MCSGEVVYDLTVQAGMIQGAIGYYDSQFIKTKNRLLKTDGVLATVLPFPMQNYIAHAAVSMGKPVFMWEHGAQIEEPPSDIVMPTQFQFTTHYLTYGHAVKKKFECHIGTNNLKEVYNVGSTKKNIVRLKSEVILYATGKWFFTKTSGVIDPDTRLYNSQKKILSYLSEIGLEHKVTLKANNTPGRNEIPFDCQNIHIESTSPFTKCLQSAKLVILDTPGTTLIETLTTDVPLFILSGRFPVADSATEMLKKRAVVADNADDLIHGLKNYLKNGTFSADVNDKEFLKAYGSIQSISEAKMNTLSIIDQVFRIKKTQN